MGEDRRDQDRRAEAEPTADERRSEDRRQGERRLDDRVAVEIWFEEELGEEMSLRRTANLSPGGVQFDRGLPHPLGSKVRLCFSLPGEDYVFKLLAEVKAATWEDDRPLTNLEFLDLSGDDHIRISKFIEALGPVEKA